MPSFDIVSQVDTHELQNAIEQTNRELSNRFDLKGSGAKVELAEETLLLSASNAFQLKQINSVLNDKFAKRKLDVRSLCYGEVTETGNIARQTVTIRQGIAQEEAKKLVRHIKDSKRKVQTAIQGKQLRVSGKKRDDLQAIISLIQDTEKDLPLQFVNFRD